jgi:hypothetical protein
MYIELDIELMDIEPSISRHIKVPLWITLDELHPIIQGAMGWHDTHLHMYQIDDQKYEIPEDGFNSEDGYKNELEVSLTSVCAQGSEFFYIYDFGDNWWHKITVRKITTKSDNILPAWPICIDGLRACPPEDSGGIYEYPKLLEKLKNKKHPEHNQAVEWAGNFEAEVFSVSQANALISALFTWYMERKGKEIPGYM